MSKNNYNPTIEGIRISSKGMQILNLLGNTQDLYGKKIEQDNPGLTSGVIYSVIQDLTRQGFVTISKESPPFTNKIQKVFFNITDSGRLILQVVNKINTLTKDN